MRLRACGALLFFLFACATSEPKPHNPVVRGLRLANLQRAAALPWRDEGRCVVQEASNPWPIVVEQCFSALDTRKVRFRDTERRCSVASADAASLETVVGICLLSQPELAVGAVVILGTVVVAVAIKEELDAYARRRPHSEAEASRETARPVSEPHASMQEDPPPEPRPDTDGSGSRDFFPPLPPSSSPRRPECEALRVPHAGGNDFHNRCADLVPNNDFRGFNALVDGKRFDALQLATRTLWEVKTTAIETYNPYVRQVELRKQVEEGRRERDLAVACGYQFVIGVRTQEHKAMLEKLERDLTVVLMQWC